MVLQQTYGQYQKTDLRPLTTAHLAQTMTLLGMNLGELRQEIERELSNNPALEIVEGHFCPTCRKKLPPNTPCPRCTYTKNGASEEPIVFVSQPRDFQRPSRTTSREDYSEDTFSVDTENLATYVLRQVAAELSPPQRPVAVHIMNSLDENGLLAIPLSEIAQYHHVDVEDVVAVSELIQRAEPVGVAAAGPKEAMLVQLEVLGEAAPHADLASKAIQEGFEALSRRKYDELGRILGVPSSQAEKVAEFITENLNPFPARAHWGNVRHPSEAQPPVYHQPDVIIRESEDEDDPRLVIEVIWPIRGFLRVNPLFKKALNEAPSDKAEDWKADKERANLLIKCLGQRSHTLVRMMQRLTVMQRDFILKGDMYIQPLTRASLAEELDVHESTISRSVAGKSVQLPSGQIIPISRFFDRSLHIRTIIKGIIAEETTPLSDNKISKKLKEMGHKVARRTVTKYRAMEGILPAHLRQAKAKASA